MRILIFSNAYKPTISGVVTSISLFRRGLIEAGHEVHLIVPEYEDYEDDEPYIFRFPALDLPDPIDLSLVFPFRTTMWPTVRGLKPTLIHTQHPILMGELGADFAQDLGLPLVFTFNTRYDVFAQKYIPIASKLAGIVTDEIIKRYLEKCTHIVALTPSTRDFILSEYKVDVPVSIVPVPVDLSQYRNLEPQRVRARLGLEDAELLLYVGRLAEEKNLPFLLQAFVYIASMRPRARLVLVGRGLSERSLQRLACKLGIDNRVIFAGSVPHSEVPHYTAAADLFVFPSPVDTQGVVLLEAMAASVPVVAVEAPGPRDVLTGGGGVLVPLDERVFAETVVALLEDESRRRELGAQAVQVAQQYSVPSATARLIAVYEQAIAAA
ncbi:MAG: glycosyltransferase [Anaerolineae bacterium]|nr:glycosyltransferase [Anaerolineae bacterium]